MRYVIKGLVAPGTIRHNKRGEIDLFRLGQKDLKALYEEGSPYVSVDEASPTVNEQPIEPKQIKHTKAPKK